MPQSIDHRVVAISNPPVVFHRRLLTNASALAAIFLRPTVFRVFPTAHR